MADYYKWIFSGVGVAAFPVIWRIFFKKPKNPEEGITQNVNIQTKKNKSTNHSIIQKVNINVKNDSETNTKGISSLDELKQSKKIMFIDDDTKFQIVNILKKSGWVNTSIIKDLKSLDQADVICADIFFVDVNGVGKQLRFKDEGLGLAKALKQRYPKKKVVIYSAEKTGDRFHEALREADDFLSKDAEPYQFQRIVESLSKQE